MAELWCVDELQTLESLYPTADIDELASILGRSREAIKIKANRLGLKRITKQGTFRKKPTRTAWTKEEEDILRKYYPTMATSELAQKLGKSVWAVHIRANRLGITKDEEWLSRCRAQQCEGKRVDFLRHDFFSEPLTPESAYWLGFIQADGSIDLSGGANALRVQLAERDIGHLERLREDLGSNKAIIRGNPGQAVLKVNSRRLIEDLLQLGVLPRKAFSHTFPKVEEPYLVSHYLRGVFDGDGCIFLRHKRRAYDPIFDIAGGEEFCGWALDMLRKFASIVGGSAKKDKHSKGTWHVVVGGYRQVKRIYDWLYHDATRWLPRKKAVFEQMYGRIG